MSLSRKDQITLLRFQIESLTHWDGENNFTSPGKLRIEKKYLVENMKIDRSKVFTELAEACMTPNEVRYILARKEFIQERGDANGRMGEMAVMDVNMCDLIFKGTITLNRSKYTKYYQNNSPLIVRSQGTDDHGKYVFDLLTSARKKGNDIKSMTGSPEMKEMIDSAYDALVTAVSPSMTLLGSAKPINEHIASLMSRRHLTSAGFKITEFVDIANRTLEVHKIAPFVETETDFEEVKGAMRLDQIRADYLKRELYALEA